MALAGGAEGRYPSPFRYPGGKGKIANFVKMVFLQNGLVGAHYVEPFAGGASIALGLLYEEYAESVHINDLDRGVYAFWRSVLHETEELCARILDTPVTIEEWRRQRMRFELGSGSDVELGFATLFMNRTNRSGIISGGPIGGVDQGGRWKLDARYNAERLAKRVRKAGRFRDRIRLSNVDGADVVEGYVGSASTFLYADPPYYSKGSELYSNWYGAAEHGALARRVKELASPWMVSYDRTEAVCALYDGQRRIDYELSYSAAERHRGTEVMYVSPSLSLPDVAGPTHIRAEDVARMRKDGMG